MQHRCYLFEGQITNDKIFHDSDYTFPGFNVRPCVFTITVFVPLQCNIDVCTIIVFRGLMPGLTFMKDLALMKGLVLTEGLALMEGLVLTEDLTLMEGLT